MHIGTKRKKSTSAEKEMIDSKGEILREKFENKISLGEIEMPWQSGRWECQYREIA